MPPSHGRPGPPRGRGQVTVHSAHGWVVIPFTMVDREVDYETMLDSAAAVGRRGTQFERELTGLRQSMQADLDADAGRLRLRPTRG